MLKIILAISVFLVALIPILVLADHDPMAGHELNMGPVFAGRMTHAWISLAAAIVIFFLALKFMVGGALARPIMLIGFGALADAVIGLFASHEDHMQYMWLGTLLFSLSVVFGIIWMLKIFGVFMFRKAK